MEKNFTGRPAFAMRWGSRRGAKLGLLLLTLLLHSDHALSCENVRRRFFFSVWSPEYLREEESSERPNRLLLPPLTRGEKIVEADRRAQAAAAAVHLTVRLFRRCPVAEIPFDVRSKLLSSLYRGALKTGAVEESAVPRKGRKK